MLNTIEARRKASINLKDIKMKMTKEELKERQKGYHAKWLAKPGKKEMVRTYYTKWYENGGKEKQNEYNKGYRKRPHVKAKLDEYHNRPEVKAKKNARTAVANCTRLKHQNCTPAWYDKDLASEFYLEAFLADGKYEVDHIVPVRCDTVCGLNVHTNLEVMLRVSNRSKFNSYDSDMILEIEEQYVGSTYKGKQK